MDKARNSKAKAQTPKEVTMKAAELPVIDENAEIDPDEVKRIDLIRFTPEQVCKYVESVLRKNIYSKVLTQHGVKGEELLRMRRPELEKLGITDHRDQMYILRSLRRCRQRF